MVTKDYARANLRQRTRPGQPLSDPVNSLGVGKHSRGLPRRRPVAPALGGGEGVVASDSAGHERTFGDAFRERIIKAATLSHTHLARVFDGGQESGSIFMICEYLGGGSLEDGARQSGRTLSVDDGARLGRDVGSALAYVHENGMVHGALSPSKLLLDEEGRIRVSDIALAERRQGRTANA